MEATRTYDTRLDSKRRLTIRGASFEYYHVKEYSDGHIVLEPRVLTPPFEVSQRTLAMMDSAIGNFRKGQVSAPVDLSDFLADDTSLSTEANPGTDSVLSTDQGTIDGPFQTDGKSVENSDAEVRP